MELVDGKPVPESMKETPSEEKDQTKDMGKMVGKPFQMEGP